MKTIFTVGAVVLATCLLYPADKGIDFVSDLTDKGVGGSNPAVELALFGAYAFLLHPGNPALPGMRQGLSPGWPDTVLLPRLRQGRPATAKEKLHEEKAWLMRGKLGPGNAHISRLSGAAFGVGNMFSLAVSI